MDTQLELKKERHLPKISRRAVAVACAVLLVAAALVLNVVLFSGNTVVDGGFDYNMNEGRLYYRMNNSFIDCQYGSGLVKYLLDCAFHVIDRYNERFEQLGNGTIDLQKFIEMTLSN